MVALTVAAFGYALYLSINPAAAQEMLPVPSEEDCRRVALVQGLSFTPRGNDLEPKQVIRMDDPNALCKALGAKANYSHGCFDGGKRLDGRKQYAILPPNSSPGLDLHEACHGRFGAWHS